MKDMFFFNDNDREMYLFLCVVKQFADKEITEEQLMQYVREHTPPELRNKPPRKDNRTREERTKELVDTLEKMKAYLRKKYFVSETGGADHEG